MFTLGFIFFFFSFIVSWFDYRTYKTEFDNKFDKQSEEPSFFALRKLDNRKSKVSGSFILLLFFACLSWLEVKSCFSSDLENCEKKTIQTKCCVDGDYTRSGWQCFEYESCTRDVCIDD
jgi:hypothetical protein